MHIIVALKGSTHFGNGRELIALNFANFGFHGLNASEEDSEGELLVGKVGVIDYGVAHLQVVVESIVASVVEGSHNVPMPSFVGMTLVSGSLSRHLIHLCRVVSVRL